MCELNSDIDTRDFINDLDTVIYDKEDDLFEFVLETPFEIKDKKDEVIERINKIGFRNPEINDCIEAYSRYGQHDKMRMQYLIYVKCIQTVNNSPVDNQWKSRWGMYFFEKYENKDINIIAKEMNKYGLDPTVEKICNKCGKEWRQHLNTANFFVSALNYD